jgi:branched-chain amino acid transport system substrate-binding protein
MAARGPFRLPAPTARRHGLIASLVSGIALAAAPSAHAAPPCPEPIRIGLTDPLTGPFANFGKDQLQASEWAVEDINAKGGIDGCKLEIVAQDHQGKPETGIAVANRFIDVDHLAMFYGGFSAVIKAMAPIAERGKTLMFSVGANAPSIAKLGEYTYTSFPLAEVDMRAFGTYLHNGMGKQRAAVLYANNETGVPGSRVLIDSFEKAGGKVVLDEGYDPAQSDFTGLILKVRALNPDVIHVHGVNSDIVTVMAQIRQLGIQTQLTSYQGAFSDAFAKQLGAAGEGLTVTSLAPTAEQNPNVAAFVERWQKEKGRPANGLPYTQYFYDVPYIIVGMVHYLHEKNLPITGDTMRQALLAVRTFDGPMTGPVTFNDDHTVNKPVYVWHVKDGHFQYVTKIGN